MPKNQSKQKATLSKNNMESKIAVIFNPHAGLKRKLLPNLHAVTVTLEDIKDLLEQYQLVADFFPTKYAGHATELAKEVVKKGYKTVIAAGGDGTVGEVANGLMDSNAALGVLPLGSYMNIGKMLSIPMDLEKAVMLIKIGRARKIDMGVVTKISGEKLSKPFYFIESAGIGLEAEFQQYWQQLEKGDLKALFKILKSFREWYGHHPKLIIDDQEVQPKLMMLTVSNGPYTGASIPIAPKAKLNDHKLTVTLFKMTKFELLKYILRTTKEGKTYFNRKIVTYQARKVQIITGNPRLVHVDARLFGETPIEIKIEPNALNVITGYPKEGETALVKRTYLDP